MKFKGHELKKVWDRSEHLKKYNDGLVTGIRFVYESEKPEPCETCGEQTKRVIDYLGKLETQCKPTCGMTDFKI